MRRDKISRRQRRRIERAGDVVSVHPAADVAAAMARHPSSQDPRRRVSAAPSQPAPRAGGLVRRARAYVARRMVDKIGPAVVPPLVAGAVVLVAVGVVVGLALGLLAAASIRNVPGEWS